MRNHNKLRAFELADEVAVMNYRVTKNFPGSEMYGVASKMRRAAVSVPSNIVEGCAGESQTEFLRFLVVAFGSLRELLYQHTLSAQPGYVNESEIENYVVKLLEAERVLGALIRGLRKTNLHTKQPTVYPTTD